MSLKSDLLCTSLCCPKRLYMCLTWMKKITWMFNFGSYSNARELDFLWFFFESTFDFIKKLLFLLRSFTLAYQILWNCGAPSLVFSTFFDSFLLCSSFTNCEEIQPKILTKGYYSGQKSLVYHLNMFVWLSWLCFEMIKAQIWRLFFQCLSFNSFFTNGSYWWLLFLLIL